MAKSQLVISELRKQNLQINYKKIPLLCLKAFQCRYVSYEFQQVSLDKKMLGGISMDNGPNGNSVENWVVIPSLWERTNYISFHHLTSRILKTLSLSSF